MSRKNDEGKFFSVGFMISGLAGFGVLCSQMPDFGWEREVGCFPSCPWSSLFWISGCIHGRTRVLYWECKSHCFLTPAARWLLWAMFDSSLVVLVKRWPLSAVSVREHSTARCPVRDQLLPREGCGRGKQGILRVLLNEEKCTFSHFSSSCFSGSYRFWKFNSVDFRADSVALGAKLPFAVHATNMRVFGWKIALSSSFTVPFEYYFKKKCPVSEVSMWCVQKEMEMHLELIKRHLAVHVLSQCYVLGFLNDWFLRGLKFLRKNFYEACFKMHPILTQNRQCFPLRCLANNPHVHALLFM